MHTTFQMRDRAAKHAGESGGNLMGWGVVTMEAESKGAFTTMQERRG